MSNKGQSGKRASFSGKIGYVLAVAGSAVGLGKYLEIPVFGCEVRWRNLSSRVFDFDSNFWICFDHVRDSTWTNDKKKSCRSISDFR